MRTPRRVPARPARARAAPAAGVEHADVEVTVDRMAAGGDGLAREASGRVVFVRGALPGERVRARVVEEHRDYAKAVLDEVLEPSPHRRPPPCPLVAAGCGGCGWQHVDEAAQVELKLAVVREALARTGGVAEPVVRAGPPLAPFAHRTTLRLGVDADGRPGFRAHHSHRLVPVGACMVAHPRLDDLLDGLRLPGAREVTVRAGARTGERLALVDPAPAGRSFAWPDDVAVGPRAHYHEVVQGARLRVSATSFFQARADGADALVDAVRMAVGDLNPGRVVDAYAGVGLLAATVAPQAEVVALESSPAAAGDARRNLAGRAATIVTGDVARWRPVPADLVIADPARTGLGRAAAAVLAGCGAGRLVLVSCDPTALARDARLLAGLGYDLVASELVDLFPQTPHVEVVSRFESR